MGGTERGQPQSYFGPFDLPNLQGGSKDEYLTDRLTVEAAKFIERNRNRPFFLYLPEFAVHLPEQAKPDDGGAIPRQGRSGQSAARPGLCGHDLEPGRKRGADPEATRRPEPVRSAPW